MIRFLAWRKIDLILFLSTVALILFGLLILFSLELHQVGGGLFKFKKQLLFVVVGFFSMLVVMSFDYRLFKNYAYFSWLVGVLLLVAVLFFGKNLRGTTGWFVFAGVGFQPVEVMKLFLALGLARASVTLFDKFNNWGYLFGSLFLVTVPAVLTSLQPDLGSTLVLVVIWAGVFFVLPFKKKYLVLILILTILIAVLGYHFALRDYQKQRLLTFVNPTEDPLGSGYNVTQSIIAVGAGRLSGRGLGLGSQSRLRFLPEKETDFIFSSLAEQLGLLGAGLLLLLFMIWFGRLFYLIHQTQDLFVVFLLVALSSGFFAQVLINIGMNIGVAPVTGLPLPLVSYGGTSLVTTLMMLGLIQSSTYQA